MASSYTTIQGDAWDSIAYRLWGDEGLMMELIEANPIYLDAVTFPAGIILNVPDVGDRNIKTELPPWRT